ncbi:MAG TPA: PKD domain-containing protein [Thermoanaerobaculia bacterium]
MRKSIWSYLVAVLVAVPLMAAPGGEARSYAKEFGVSVEEAASRLALHQAIGELDAALAAEEAATFGGLWIEHKPEFRVVVRFTDSAAAARLSERVAGGPLESLIVTRPAQIALAELEKQQKTLRAAGNKAGVAFDSQIDVRTNRLSVFALEPAKLQATLGAAVPRGANLQRVPRLTERQSLIGGDGLSTCTAGFAVRHNTTGELGILTAAHCDNYQVFNGAYLPWKGAKESQYTDAQWHSTCGIVATENKVKSYDGTRTITTVRSRTYQAAGHYVCKFGAVTGYTCGTIETKHYDPGTGYDGTFVRVNNSNNAYGDSGAPWYQEHVALGIHHGVAWDNEAIYQPLDYISPLGVSVLTSAPGNCTVAPVASFTYSEVPRGTFNFDASASYDPNGSIVSYSWDFGDGTYETNAGPYTSHWFDQWTEYYTVWLTVTDSEGATRSTSRTVRVCNGPGQMVCPY